MIQLRVYLNDGTPVYLDLYETEPIKLTLSIEDITSTDATSVFSKTFKVPATRDNNEFFQNAWEIDGIDFDITIKVRADILVDGAEFKTGHVRLQKIYANGDLDKVDYELLFLGETRDFSSAIGETTMCQLTLTDFTWYDADGNIDLQYTNADDFIGDVDYTTVTDSWQAFPEGSLTDGVADGDLLFPLIDHGAAYDEDGDVIGGTVTLGGNGQDNSFNHSSNAISPQRLKPMIRAKRLWDQIFENSGYTYESNFLTTDQFAHMYVSAFGNQESISINVDQAVAEIFEASDIANSGNNDIDYYGFFPNVTFSNPAYQVNVPDVGAAGGSYFTAPGDAVVTGAYYQFTFGGQVSATLNNSNGGGTAVDCVARLNIVDAVGGTILHTLATGNPTSNGNWSTGAYDSRNGGYQPQTGEIFQIDFTSVQAYDTHSVGEAYWNCQATPGDYYSLRDLDCDYQQIDFIKDVITMFRLVMQPAIDRPNHFIIEPWKDFIGSGVVYDWSNKLIREKDFISEPLFNTQSALIEFTKQEDEDYINKYHQDNNKHAYGWLRFNAGNELLKGKREVKVLGIAPTPIDQIINYSTNGSHDDPEFIIPQIFEITGQQDQHDQNERLAIKPNTRFLFYNGLVDINNNHSEWYMIGDNNSQEQYPLVSPYEYWPILNIPEVPPAAAVNTLNLNFANDTRYFMEPDPGQGADPNPYGQIPNTLYQTFWARYIESLYNKFSRRVTAYFTLNNVDLQDLTFDDVIFIDGKYYRPEKVIDVQVGNKTAVKCELITLKDQRPIWLDEPLFNFSVAITPSPCAGAGGSIQVTTEGTPDFSWQIGDDPILLSGSYSAPVGQTNYIFNIDGVPLGQHELTVTDALGRSATTVVDIPQSISIVVTATHVVTNALFPNCGGEGSIGNGEILVTPAGGSPAYTIVWTDPNLTGFNPTSLSPGDYEYYVVDSNGCVSDNYIATVVCDVVYTNYILREHLNGCTEEGLIDYIAESTNTHTVGQTVSLSEIPGCFFVVAETEDEAQYTITNAYNECSDCDSSDPIARWRIESCETPTQVTYLVPPVQAIAPGDIITVNETSSPKCWEVKYSQPTGVGSKTLQNIFLKCIGCEATPYGWQYFAVFCDGQDPPQYFNSDTQLAQGDVVKVLDGTYIDRCVEIVLEAPGEATVGNIDTSQVYEDCDDCDGITDPQVCTTVYVTGPNDSKITYDQNGNSFTEDLTPGVYYKCGSNFTDNGGVEYISSAINCIANGDCGQPDLTCYTLNGGTTGTTFQYQDGIGQFLTLFVDIDEEVNKCVVTDSATVVTGDGTAVNNFEDCVIDADCEPADPCVNYIISNNTGSTGFWTITQCDGNILQGIINDGTSTNGCSIVFPTVSAGLIVTISVNPC